MRRDWSDSSTGSEKFDHDHSSERGSDKLRHHVRHHVGYIDFTPDQNAECHRRVIMRAGDMAAGVNHDHERRANGERRDDTRAGPDSGATNCQDKEESSDEFGDVLVHSYFLGQSALKKQEHQQWDFGLIDSKKTPNPERRTFNIFKTSGSR